MGTFLDPIALLVRSSSSPGPCRTTSTGGAALGCSAFRPSRPLTDCSFLTNFYKPLNSEGGWILGLYLLTATVLVLAFVGSQSLVRSRLGRVLVAVRDNETRLYFLGYRPELYKVAAFVIAAMLAAVGGIGPDERSDRPVARRAN